MLDYLSFYILSLSTKSGLLTLDFRPGGVRGDGRGENSGERDLVLGWSPTFLLVCRQNREPLARGSKLGKYIKSRRRESPSPNKSISRVSFSSSCAI